MGNFVQEVARFLRHVVPSGRRVFRVSGDDVVLQKVRCLLSALTIGLLLILWARAHLNRLSCRLKCIADWRPSLLLALALRAESDQ